MRAGPDDEGQGLIASDKFFVGAVDVAQWLISRNELVVRAGDVHSEEL